MAKHQVRDSKLDHDLQYEKSLDKEQAPNADDESVVQSSADTSALPPDSKYRRIKRYVLFLAFLYIGVCLMLALIQRKLIYFPTHEVSLSVIDWQLPEDHFHDISIKSEDGLTLHGWHVLPPGRSALDNKERKWELELGRPVILYFSGNAGHRGYRHAELHRLSQLNADVFLIDYRGYGENRGVPSEKNFLRDARSAWDYLVLTENISADRILLLGESLGGGVATALASELIQEGIEPGGLFLKTTFTSLVDVAALQFPWIPCRMLVTQRYSSIDVIPRVTCPISILHGINDELIPIELSQRLFDAAPDQSNSNVLKTFIELPTAGHNDVLEVDGDSYMEAVAAMLNEIRR
ncbi:MAG: alpha/beta fold hydrolase [Planctomycetaceae bacterium]|nr:alpha/beta fold hydrolase [Planctomycetaceae bacterium]